MNPRLPRLLLLLIAGLAAVFWLVAWQGMDRSALARVPILDEAHYLQRAAEIRADGWLPDEPFTMSPLYSYLVAATGSGRQLDRNRVRLGNPPYGIRVLQAVMWLGTGFLLWLVGRNLFGPAWAWGPPLLWLGYAPAAILAGQVLMEIPLTCATTTALALATGVIGPASRSRRALGVGALLGAAFLLRGTAIVLMLAVIPALAGGAFWRERRAWGATTVGVAGGLLLVILPFTLINSTRAGRLVPPALNGGVNLYLGNGPGANGFFHGIPDMDVENDASGVAYLSRRLGRTVPDAAAADRVWSSLARTAMREDPARVLGLWAKKVWLHLVGVEIPQVSSFAAWQRAAPALRLLIVPWALLVALGLAGGLVGWRRWPLLRPWLLSVLLLIAVQSLFFVVTRYRIVLVPTLALASVALLRAGVSGGRRAAVQALLGVLAATLIVWPWGLKSVRRDLAAGGLDNEAVRWEHLATATSVSDSTAGAVCLAEATALWDKSLAVDPARPDPWRGKARALWAAGDRELAVATLTRGQEAVDRATGLRRDLIGMLMRQGDLPAAESALSRALRVEAPDAELLHNLVLVQNRQEKLTAAALTARRLVELFPDDARGYVDLGAVLGRAGRLPEAAAVYESGLTRLPDNAELRERSQRIKQMLSENP